MKGNMMIFASLYFLLCWMLPVDSMAIRFNFTFRDSSQSFPLNMVDDSVDDMYFGCNEAMMNIVKKRYFEKEKRVFANVWNSAEECADRNMAETEDKALTKDHMRAICVYTSDEIYREFNNAVRTEKRGYGSKFQFHSLHFLLTSAIQILNNNPYCHTTYRRTTVDLTGNVNQIFRFGFFSSSSFRPDLKDFGSATCFKIKTCLGAFLENYSIQFGEEEVLIPPYEMFKITEKVHGKDGKIKGLDDCNVIYVLEGIGMKSNLNCKILHEHPAQLYYN
ncbi:GPI-linked NAD(P)(+)--arginine ADP-ribosyltransferase 1 [Nibea albiflora]|uniref:GPI-linked NAD(P)(+)--arginine ADP-ribosyltransferase 1 n=1 Tax=Nibea albiflora TaxID=240163 RepID=A0ACB7FJH6_NIBAL|nr:GPI-linked NAD(P)(+)--arginine ADP-ribosyltransferase 1 [Nibea albiflora]